MQQPSLWRWKSTVSAPPRSSAMASTNQPSPSIWFGFGLPTAFHVATADLRFFWSSHCEQTSKGWLNFSKSCCEQTSKVHPTEVVSKTSASKRTKGRICHEIVACKACKVPDYPLLVCSHCICTTTRDFARLLATNWRNESLDGDGRGQDVLLWLMPVLRRRHFDKMSPSGRSWRLQAT